MTDMFRMTDEQVAEIERRLAENDEIRAAIKKIERRRDRDAHLLELLNLGDMGGHVGDFAHDGAVAAARSINGES